MILNISDALFDALNNMFYPKILQLLNLVFGQFCTHEKHVKRKKDITYFAFDLEIF